MRVRQDVSFENLECDHASLNERTMMLKIGLMRQAVNVNGKAGRDLNDRLSAHFPSDLLLLRADSTRQAVAPLLRAERRVKVATSLSSTCGTAFIAVSRSLINPVFEPPIS
ncbi:MAG: hypothetical protein QOJ02_530 [Acidobacteriota bacterium]|nr:hypothetical protein [Acidobacteriota bacterium]